MNASPSIQLLYLDHQKTRCLSQTLQAILALEGTEETFGQIIDGLSTFANAVRIAMDPWRHGIEDRQHPTEVSVELFRAFRDKLQPHLLMVDAKVGYSHHILPQLAVQGAYNSRRLHKTTKTRPRVLMSSFYNFWSSPP